MHPQFCKPKGEGNSVLACFVESNGREEDLVAMVSLSKGVIKMELDEGEKTLDVVEHCKVEPRRNACRILIGKGILSLIEAKPACKAAFGLWQRDEKS